MRRPSWPRRSRGWCSELRAARRRPVKWLGDGVMFYFRDPGAGRARGAGDGGWGGGRRAAAGARRPARGPVLFQEGDYFGQTVNLAARIADYARPGEVLVTQGSSTPRTRTACVHTRSARWS